MKEKVSLAPTYTNIQNDAVTKSMVYQMKGSIKTLEQDLDILEDIKHIYSVDADIKIFRSMADIEYLSDIKSIEICRRILGPILIDMLKRRFTVRINGLDQDVYVHPKHMFAFQEASGFLKLDKEYQY